MAAEPPTNRIPDDRLLRLVAAGDANAFTELFRRRHPDVFRFALHLTGSAATADDIVQDVFLIVMRDAARYDAGRATVTAWLCGIARNCARQRLARDSRPAPDELAGGREPCAWGRDSVDPLDGLLRTERIDALRRAIQTLPLPYREALVLCDLQELAYAEAAQAAGCPVGTVRSRLHRARALLAAKVAALAFREADARTVEPEDAEPEPRPRVAGTLRMSRSGTGAV
ncbi:MAG: sigma-70 family RNA polymerase sigma factor [Acidobacteriota bacterium]